MNKKFLSAILCGALALASTSTFTSCKDYDDDITSLEQKLNAQDSELTKLVSDKVDAANAAIASLKAQQDALDAAYKAADAQLASDIESAKTYADTQAAAAQRASIAAAQEQVDKAVKDLNASIDAANKRIDQAEAAINEAKALAQSAKDDAAVNNALIVANQEKIAALVAADAELQKGIDAAQARADQAYALAEQAKAATEANAAAIEAVSAGLKDAKDALAASIDANKTDIAAAAKLAAENKAAIEAQAATIADLKKANDDAAAARKDLAKDIKANSDKIAVLEALINTKMAEVEAAYKAAIAAEAEQTAKAISELSGVIATVDVKVNDNKTAIESCQVLILGLDGDLKAIAEEVQYNSEDIKALYDKSEELSAKLTGMYNDLNQAIEDNAGNIEAANLQIDRIFTLLNDYYAEIMYNQLDIEANNMKIDRIHAILNDYAADIITNQEDIAALIEKSVEISNTMDVYYGDLSERIEANVDNIDMALQEIGKNAANITELQSALLEQAEANEIALDELKSEIEEQIKTLVGSEEGIATIKELDDNINHALQEVIAVKGTLAEAQSAISELTETVDIALQDILNSKGDIKTLQSQYTELAEEVVAPLGTTVAGHTHSIDMINKQIADEINPNIIAANKQLKSLVYAPTQYIDGIECIMFTTLNYKDWANAWEQDAPTATNQNYVIDNESQYEEYFVNPRNVAKESIAKLEFVSNNAHNTRAGVNKTAPISISSWDLGYSNRPEGKQEYVAKLNIKKNVTTSFGVNRDDFTIVALKATLKDKVDDEEVNVYSDWARIAETSVTPYIHAKGMNETTYSTDKYGKSSHFWAYTVAYGGTNKTVDQGDTYNDRFVAKEVYYKDNLDLLTLVDVCDKAGHTIDMEKYHLAYEFHLMDYKLKNELSTVDATNQKHFAKLDGSIISSTARDNTTAQSRDAIGRQPMIQAVLKDTKNNKVVDVKYFKIKWIDKIEVINYGNISNNTRNYACGADASQMILEEVVNAIYTKVDMSKPEFHATYRLYGNLYSNYNDAVNGINENRNLGSIEDVSDWYEPGQTHNLKWTINTRDNAATQAEYNAGKKVITAYGYFYQYANPQSKIVFELKLNLNIAKMDYKVNKDEAMWNAGKRNVNPQLESDPVAGNSVFATTQIYGNFLPGYIYNGTTPGIIDDLVNFGDEVKIVFDPAGLAQLPGGVAAGWNISTDGLTLKRGSEIAAEIVGDRIQLKESANGAAGSVPTASAKALIAQNVKVKVVDKWCALEQIIDSYDVYFMTPLAFTANYANISLNDVTAGGSSSTTLAGTWEIKEHYTTNKRVVYDNKATGSLTNPTLVDWYKVEPLVYDIANAKTNVQLNGTIGSACNVPLSSIKNADNSPKYTVAIVGNTVTFENKSGNAIGQPIKIAVPVTVKTKWQSMSATLNITINPALSTAKTR